MLDLLPIMDTTGLDTNLSLSAQPAEKILISQCARFTIQAHFGGLENVKYVIKHVRFNYVQLKCNALAETSRNSGADVDYKININDKSKKFFDKNPSSVKLIRMWFVLAVTIVHEICHLALRKLNVMYTPEKLLGLNGPEAGEYFEKLIFNGVVSMRLSHFEGNKRGWDPVNMSVEAVVLKFDLSPFRSLSDSELSSVLQSAIDWIRTTPFGLFLFRISQWYY